MRTPNLVIQINPHTNGMPEVPATFPGGMDALRHFIKMHLNYPFEALEEGVEGEVYVGFQVMEDGSIGALRVLQSLHVECDREALRILEKMPAWKPAQNVGFIVPVQVKMPIVFKLATVPAEYA